MKILTASFFYVVILLTGYDGVSNGITNPKVKWKFKTQGPVRGSAVVTADHIYFGSAEGFFYALNKSDGSLLWKYETKGAIVGAASVSTETVVLTSRDNFVYALNSKTGELTWKFEMNPIFPGYMEWEYFTAAPVVSGNKVLIGSGDSHLYALNLSDGKLLWKFKTGGRIRSTPLVDNQTVYQASHDGIIYALDIETGKLQWGFKTLGASLDKSSGFDRTHIFSKPCLKNGLLVFGSRDGNVYAIDIKTGNMKWKFSYGMTWAMSTTIEDETVFVGWSTNNTFSALDLKTGNEKWKYLCNSVVFSTAAIQGNQVVFGSGDGNLYCMDKTTGKKNWQYNIGREIHSSPVYDGSAIYFGSDDGYFYALAESEKFYTAVYHPKNESTAYPLIEEKITPYLKDKDFKQLDSAKLYRFIKDRIEDKAPSVIVFAYDIVPSNIMGENPEKGMVRQYLEAGGKVIWLGGIPNLFYFTSKGKFVGPKDISIASRLLETEFGSPEESGNYYSKATQDGLNLGLPVWFKSTHSASPKNVIPLAYDEYGRVSAWMKRFNPRPSSGFISLRTWAWAVAITNEDLEMIHRVAMWGLE
ncbi:MAG TPA: PQQ-binding-like beta-propeller repeat protein [Ohtaekwangia sp.]|nr:PQQ-binding-like beta-propeller repeat protein [Ohtaekwangia sp.]